MDGNGGNSLRSEVRCTVTRTGPLLRVALAQEICPCASPLYALIAVKRIIPCTIEPLRAGHYEIDLGARGRVPRDVTAEGTRTACELRSEDRPSPYPAECAQDADCAVSRSASYPAKTVRVNVPAR